MPVTVKRSRCGKLIVMWHTYLAGSKAFVLNRDMDAGTVEAQVRANPSFASHVTREREALSRRTCASEQRRTSDCICLGSDEQGEVETEAGASSDDEVEEVAPPAPPPRITFAVEGDDEVQGMAAAGGLHDLPHLRGFCLHKPFVRTHRKRPHEGNAATCCHCYCFICDRPAAECPQWESEERKAPSHCNAHGGHKQWRLLQGRAKRARDRAELSDRAED